MHTRRTLLGVFGMSILHGQHRDDQMFSDAESYERFMGRWSRLGAPLLVDFAGIADTGGVLDIGSGTGSLSFTIAEKKPRCQVVGIDPSQEYVAYATRRNNFGGRVRFEVGDAQQLRIPDATFESSLSFLVFNFIPDSRKALLEARRVTKAGGRIAATVWDYGAEMRMLRMFWDAAVSLDATAEALDEKHMPLSRAGDLAKLWKQCGLDQVEERPLEITMRYKSFADYWDPFLLGQGPAGAYVRRLAPDHVARLRDDLKRRLSISSENESFNLPARFWAVRGSVPPPP